MAIWCKKGLDLFGWASFLLILTLLPVLPWIYFRAVLLVYDGLSYHMKGLF